MSNYRRNFLPGGTFFFTVTLLDRKQDLLMAHIDVLRDSVRRVRHLYPFEIVACVVLPEHLHCIWTLPEGDGDFATRWRLIKLLFAKALPRNERISAARAARNERGVWARRYWEHTIRDERDMEHHVNYIHANPVKHGCVTQVRDWPYSTFHQYVRAGVLAADWAGNTEHADIKAGG